MSKIVKLFMVEICFQLVVTLSSENAFLYVALWINFLNEVPNYVVQSCEVAIQQINYS